MYQMLTDNEISRVLDQARSYGPVPNRTKWVALLTLLVNYGPRISEALALRWEQIDFGRQTITLTTLKRRKPMTRTLPLMPAVSAVLAEYRATANGDPRVFPMPKHGRTMVWRAFQRMCERAGIPRIKLHALRHSCASRLVKIDLVMARDTLGHANISTTDAYLHADRLQEQFAVLQAIV